MRSSCCHALLLEGGLHTGEGMDLFLVQLAVHSELLDHQKAEISRVSNWSGFQVGGELDGPVFFWGGGDFSGEDLKLPIGSLDLVNFVSNFCFKAQ